MKNKRGHDKSYAFSRAGIIHLLPLILVGILLVGGLGAAYYFGKNSNTPLLTKSSPEPEVMMEETSDWEVYEGEGFSFKYPEGFETQYIVFVELDENEYTKRLENNILNYQKTIVGENSFYVGYVELGGRYRQEALLEKNNMFYEFIIDTPISDLAEYTEEALNQLELTQSKILSTFQFTEDASMKVYEGRRTPTYTYLPFTLEYPSDWEVEEEDNTELHVTFSKGEYVLSVGHLPVGGGVCNFEDSPPHILTEGREKIQDYDQINGNITFRIYSSELVKYNVCMKELTGSGYYTVPPVMGVIGYSVPENADDNVLEEMNNILKSIKINE